MRVQAPRSVDCQVFAATVGSDDRLRRRTRHRQPRPHRTRHRPCRSGWPTAESVARAARFRTRLGRRIGVADIRALRTLTVDLSAGFLRTSLTHGDLFFPPARFRSEGVTGLRVSWIASLQTCETEDHAANHEMRGNCQGMPCERQRCYSRPSALSLAIVENGPCTSNSSPAWTRVSGDGKSLGSSRPDRNRVTPQPRSVMI